MSIITYNGCRLALTKINSFVQEPVYSDDGIDYLYTHFMLDVSACVNLNAKPTMSNVRVNPTTTLSDYIRTLREQLNQPRASLEIYLGADETIYPQTGSLTPQLLLFSPAPDAKGGPFPRGVTITQVGGSRTLMVRFIVETFVSEQFCSEGRSTPRQMLSNRYDMSFGYDSEGMATRTIRGTLVVDISKGIQADDFRCVCVPKLLDAWKRKRMDFVQNTDGTKLAYTIEDQEVYLAAPEGITTIEGTYTENVTVNGAQVFADVEVRAKAPKNITKEWLLTRALQVAHSRVEVNANFRKGNDLLKSASVRENLFANEITVALRVQKFSETVGKRMGVPMDSQIGNFLFYINKDGNYRTLEPDGTPSYVQPYGTALVEAAYAAWGNQCDDPERTKNAAVTSRCEGVTDNPQENPESDETNPSTEPPVATVSTADDDTFNMVYNRLKWDAQHRQESYTEYSIREHIRKYGNVAPMPVQKPPQKLEPSETPSLPTPKPPDPVPERPKSRWKWPQFPPGTSVGPPYGLSTYWTPPDIIMLSPPKQERLVSWTAERAAAWPLCPIAYERLENGDVLIDKEVSFLSPTLGPDGETFIYNVQGEYRYCVTLVADEIAVPQWAGNMPWISDPEDTDGGTKVFGVPPELFQPGIADDEKPDAFTDEELGIA